ncbi:amidohydrolase [Ilyonectria robusta]
MISCSLPLASLAVLMPIGLVHASSVLFTGGTIIAFDDATNDLDVIRNGTLLIKNDRIAGIWPAGERHTVPVPSDVEVIDAAGKILSPGFVDTHRHGWQTLYKTRTSNTTILEYFVRYGEYTAAGRLDAEQVYISQLAGLYEGLNAGTTTSLDHAHHTWSDETSYAGLNASFDSGARVFWAHAFHEVINYTISQQLANFRNIANDVSFENTTVSLGVACDLFDTVGLGSSVTAVFDLAE